MRTVYRTAIRVEVDPSVEVRPWLAFTRELEYWCDGQDKIDAELQALNIRVKLPERVAIPAGATISAPVPVSIEDTLAEVNEKARRELDADKYPAPDDCPEPGTWVRAARLDADMQPEPEGKWHRVTGWVGRTGGLGVECFKWGRNRTLNRALAGGYGPHRRSALLQSQEQPSDDACRQCVSLRDKRAISGDD